MDVGFIGLGHMGQAMARTLLKAGHRVTVYNRTHSKEAALAADGANIAARPSDVCHGDALITMLSDDAAVEDMVLGSGHILAALDPNTVHISMSTISVALSERLAEAHEKADKVYVAAPVLGRPEAAASGQLFILAAGPSPAIAFCQPLLEAMGQKTFVLDERQPVANLAKLAGNFLIASMLESLGETMALVRKSGMDPHRFVDIITNSLFAAPAYKTYGTIIADEKYDPPGFTMSLALKDMRLVLAAADATAVPMPVASVLRDHLLAGVAQGEGHTDWSRLAQLSARRAGLTPH